jgi:transcriptional regulator with XRE-family HTH domain
MDRQSPIVRRRRLGVELRRLRESAGKTIEQTSKALDCSISKISRIETGQVVAAPRDVRDMLEVYGVIGQQRDALVQIAREARERGWWQAYADMDFAAHVGYEVAAAEFRIYQALVVPGLLQTPEYAEAVTRALLPEVSEAEIERRLSLRTRRRALLQQPNPPALWGVLDEAVLRRPVGGLGVLREQLNDLLEAAQQPNITLQVLPFAAGGHAGLDGSFAIMRFPDPSDRDIVYLDHATNPLLLERPAELARYVLVFDHLRATALAPTDSVDFLAAASSAS